MCDNFTSPRAGCQVNEKSIIPPSWGPPWKGHQLRLPAGHWAGASTEQSMCESSHQSLVSRHQTVRTQRLRLRKVWLLQPAMHCRNNSRWPDSLGEDPSQNPVKLLHEKLEQLGDAMGRYFKTSSNVSRGTRHGSDSSPPTVLGTPAMGQDSIEQRQNIPTVPCSWLLGLASTIKWWFYIIKFEVVYYLAIMTRNTG